MGVGIAIPISMQLNSISMVQIRDYIDSVSKPRDNDELLNRIKMGKSIQLFSDPWTIAVNTRNTLVCLQIEIDGKPLYIGTYHMPCLYDMPEFMAIHSSIVEDLMFQMAGEQNFILAGDFNIKPSETCYQALTEKDYVDNIFPKSSIYDISYQPKVEQVMKSAYREKNGGEPVYTNFAYISTAPSFCATLDYIFFHGQLKVEKVLELTEQPTGESYPDATHPSDHLMIAATFQLL